MEMQLPVSRQEEPMKLRCSLRLALGHSYHPTFVELKKQSVDMNFKPLECKFTMDVFEIG